MKKRNSGPCPLKAEVEGGVYSPSKKKAVNYLLVKYLLHQIQNAGQKGGVSNKCFKVSLGGGGKAPPPPPSLPPVSHSDSTPLDLSLTSKWTPAKPRELTPSKGNAKELRWKPLPRPSSLGGEGAPVAHKWFPLVPKAASKGAKSPPKFYPLSRRGKLGQGRFPWMNPLNRIFLQEKSASGGEDGEEKKAQTPAVDRKTPDSTSVSSSLPKSDKPSPTALHSLKPAASNPFKITPTNTWPAEYPEHPPKLILAPSKFAPNSGSGFGKFGSGAGCPPAPMSKMGPVLASPTLSINLLAPPGGGDTPKSTFKLKPSSLGSSRAVTSSSFAVKRPAPEAESEGGADSSSPARVPSEGAETPPEAKRPRTGETPPESTSPPPPLEGAGKNSSGVSSSTSEGRNEFPSASPPAPPKGENPPLPSNAIPTFVPLNNSNNMEASSTEERYAEAEGISPLGPSRVNGVGATSSPLSSKLGNAGFIFGQNLEYRAGVSSTSSGPCSAQAFSNGETTPAAQGGSPSSGLNLFTAAASSLATPSSSTSEGGKSLSETSREFSLKEESLKTKYEEVQTLTGEEGEKNVIQMNCKLYGWSSGSWQERGRGLLRLNDREIRDELHSRLVIRTQGTLTVMLNAKIWAEMSVEKPNDKSVRFTALDTDGQPKIYLVMGSPKDITLLHNSLEYRVAAARSQTLDEIERQKEQDSDTPSLLV